MLDHDEKDEPSIVYLVVLDQPVVAEDLEATILEFAPSVRVLKAPTLAAAARVVRDVGRVTAALVDAGPGMFLQSDLAGMPALAGAAVVLMGDDAEAEAETAGWPCLARPFGPEQVLAALEEALRRVASA